LRTIARALFSERFNVVARALSVPSVTFAVLACA
jgi:hypothetical protein